MKTLSKFSKLMLVLCVLIITACNSGNPENIKSIYYSQWISTEKEHPVTRIDFGNRKKLSDQRSYSPHLNGTSSTESKTSKDLFEIFNKITPLEGLMVSGYNVELEFKNPLSTKENQAVYKKLGLALFEYTSPGETKPDDEIQLIERTTAFTPSSVTNFQPIQVEGRDTFQLYYDALRIDAHAISEKDLNLFKEEAKSIEGFNPIIDSRDFSGNYHYYEFPIGIGYTWNEKTIKEFAEKILSKTASKREITKN